MVSSPTDQYETALTLISEVIRLMNTIQTAPKPADMGEEAFQLIRSMRISLMGMSFDQTLSMWQTLGGTLVPAVAYKIRMVTVTGEFDESKIGIVKKVSIAPAIIDPETKEPKTLTLPPASMKKFEEELGETEGQPAPEPAVAPAPKARVQTTVKTIVPSAAAPQEAPAPETPAPKNTRKKTSSAKKSGAASQKTAGAKKKTAGKDQ